MLFGKSKAQDELLRKKLLADLHRDPPPRNAAAQATIAAMAESISVPGGDSVSNSALVTTLTSRLTKLEAELRSARAEAAQKTHTAAELRREVELLRVQAKSDDLIAEVQDLRVYCSCFIVIMVIMIFVLDVASGLEQHCDL